MAKSPRSSSRCTAFATSSPGLGRWKQTIELALATIDQESTSNDAQDVRLVALMLTKRLRKLESQIHTHYDLSNQGAPP